MISTGLKKVMETGVSLSVGVLLGNLGRGSVYREQREIVEGGLQKWIISLYESCQGNLEEGQLCWGSRSLCKGRLWRWSSLFTVAPLGNLEGGSFTRDFERQMKGGSGSGAFDSEGAL